MEVFLASNHMAQSVEQPNCNVRRLPIHFTLYLTRSTYIGASVRNHFECQYLSYVEILHDHSLNPDVSSAMEHVWGGRGDEQLFDKLMPFAGVQRSGGAERVRWSSTAVPSPGLDDSSIKSPRPAPVGQTCWALLTSGKTVRCSNADGHQCEQLPGVKTQKHHVQKQGARARLED